MSKWLSARMKGDTAPRHELFTTEARAIEALNKALNLHRQKGRTVTEKWEGTSLRYEVADQDGEFVAVHWLSDTNPTANP